MSVPKRLTTEWLNLLGGINPVVELNKLLIERPSRPSQISLGIYCQIRYQQSEYEAQGAGIIILMSKILRAPYRQPACSTSLIKSSITLHSATQAFITLEPQHPNTF